MGGARIKKRRRILTLGDRERAAQMVLQPLSRMRKGTRLCASMGAARIKQRGRTLAFGAWEPDQLSCTRYTKITVASPTTEAPPVFRGEVRELPPHATSEMIVAGPATDVPTI